MTFIHCRWVLLNTSCWRRGNHTAVQTDSPSRSYCILFIGTCKIPQSKVRKDLSSWKLEISTLEQCSKTTLTHVRLGGPNVASEFGVLQSQWPCTLHCIPIPPPSSGSSYIHKISLCNTPFCQYAVFDPSQIELRAYPPAHSLAGPTTALRAFPCTQQHHSSHIVRSTPPTCITSPHSSYQSPARLAPRRQENASQQNAQIL